MNFYLCSNAKKVQLRKYNKTVKKTDLVQDPEYKAKILLQRSY